MEVALAKLGDGASAAIAQEVARLDGLLLAGLAPGRPRSQLLSDALELRRVAHLVSLCAQPEFFAGPFFRSIDGLELEYVLNRFAIVLPRDRLPGRLTPAADVPPGAEPAPVDEAAYKRMVRELRDLVERSDEPENGDAPDAWRTEREPKESTTGGMVGRLLRRAVNVLPPNPRVTRKPWQELLSAEARAVIAGLGLNITQFSTPARLLRKLASLRTPRQPRKRKALIGGTLVALDGVKAPNATPPPTTAENESSEWPLVYQSHLLVIRERLKAYEMTDISQVENILAGEHKNRSNRVLDRLEIETIERTETERSRETETQTTDRNELQTEAEKAIQTAFEAHASLSISGDYGPSVKFSSEVGGSLSRTTTETTRRAETHAREVVEKAVERLVQKSSLEQRRRILQEVETLDEHGVDNRGRGEHVRGVYRWLNKIVELQLFNHGLRTLVEFIVPEPAANYLYLLGEHAPEDIALVTEVLPPTDPDVADPQEKDWLTPDSNWLDEHWGLLAQRYRVTGLPPRPSGSRLKSVTVAAGLNGDEPNLASGTITLDEGWKATRAYVKINRAGGDGGWYVNVRVGNYLFAKDDDNDAQPDPSDVGPYVGEVPYFVISRRLRAIAVAIMIKCEPTEESIKAWRAQVYDAIIGGYSRLKEEYDDQLRREVANEVVRRETNRNAVALERVVRTELQRAFLSLLLGNHLNGFDGFQAGAVPRYQFTKAKKEGGTIAFLQQAFEWENMNFIFYPYFWGRSANWARSVVDVAEPDPLFASFLKAGAARVQVPVRAEFDATVRNWLHSGISVATQNLIFEDGSPLLEITEEQVADRGGRPGDGVPVGDSWESRIPTDLDFLMNEVTLPLRDPLVLQQPPANAVGIVEVTIGPADPVANAAPVPVAAPPPAAPIMAIAPVPPVPALTP